MNELPLNLKRDYRAVSMALCSAVVGVLFMRILVYFVPFDTSSYGGTLASDALFSLTVQLVFFLAVPFCIYMFYGKRSFKQTLEYSSFKGFKPYHLMALPLGFCVFIVTLGISSIWAALLSATGYNYSSSTPLPDNFVAGYFVADIVLTAVLPAVCEEFVMRGGLLTTAKTRFGTVGCVVLCGVAFGLFHQNIRQVFYTMLFGALAAYLTLELKSIFPAVFLHFANNFLGVYFDYASTYGWAVGGSFYDIIDILSGRVWALFIVLVSIIAIGVGLVFLMLYFKEKRVIARKMEILKDSAFDATKKRVVLMGDFDPDRIEELEMEKEVYGADYTAEKFKPAPRDIMLIVALGVVTVLTTIFTYVWGFFY